ncbi:MAG: EamA family transporter [Anaerolineales bacterium]|nr:EamA family transporter [Anaerolineales bacterium]
MSDSQSNISGAPVSRGSGNPPPARRTLSDTASGIIAALLASACWGTSGIFVKLVALDSGVTALSLAFWRDITSFFVLLIGLRLFKPEWLKIQRRDLRWMVGLGASLGIFHVTWNLAVMLNGAAVATVQQAAMPAIVVVAAWILWREPLTWIKFLAVALAIIGTAMASGLDVLGQAELSAGGVAVGMGLPILYAAWNLFGKQIRQRYNSLTMLTYGFGVAALVLGPLQFFTPQPFPVPVVSLLWFAAFILISTILPFSIYIFALGRLPASVASLLAMSEIAFVVLYAIVLLGERLTPSQILGAILVVGGVFLLSWRNWRENGKRKKDRVSLIQ